MIAPFLATDTLATDTPPSDDAMLALLRGVARIAMVGVSSNSRRPAHMVMKYLLVRGYEVVPVNPLAAAKGEAILGRVAVASLAEVPAPCEMVDVFRSDAAAEGVAQEAASLVGAKGFRLFWMQFGVTNPQARAVAVKAGMRVVYDRCPKVEYGRLHGELSRGGFASGVISSKPWPSGGM